MENEFHSLFSAFSPAFLIPLDFLHLFSASKSPLPESHKVSGGLTLYFGHPVCVCWLLRKRVQEVRFGEGLIESVFVLPAAWLVVCLAGRESQAWSHSPAGLKMFSGHLAGSTAVESLMPF